MQEASRLTASPLESQGLTDLPGLVVLRRLGEESSSCSAKVRVPPMIFALIAAAEALPMFSSRRMIL